MPDTDSRLKTSLKTTGGTFHQVVAVTQEALNDGLFYLFDKYTSLQTIQVSNYAGKLDAKLDAAEVSLPVKTSNYRTVVFYCRFNSGTLRLVNGQGGLGEPIDVTKWRFAFDVDYTTLDVPDNTAEHEEVKKKLNQPGDYSIKRLFLDFTTHKIALFREELSDFGKHKWQGDDKSKFQSVMFAWGDTNKESTNQPKWALGYYLTTKKPESVNPVAPTFPPTAMKHQHYKYIAPGKNEPDDGLEKGKNNMLLYLEMTQNISFPTANILEYSGNFVAAGMQGTACISRDIFWDAYLLCNPPLDASSGPTPLLRQFNRELYAWLEELHVKVDSMQAVIAFRNGFGIEATTDVPEPSRSPNYFAWQSVSPTEWKFEKITPEMYKWDKGALGYWVEAKASAETLNRLSFTAGKNEIHLNGRSRLWVWDKQHVWSNAEEEASVTIEWETTITIDSVSDGGLGMTLQVPPNPTDLFKITLDSKPSMAESEDPPPPSEGPRVQDLKDAAQRAIRTIDFDKIRNNLSNALKSSARFVLPGGQEFFYKNPIFNDTGDLLVEASYKS